MSVQSDDSSAEFTINNYLKNALEQKASDVHLEPLAQKYMVRYRIDGSLRKIEEGDLQYYKGIVSSIKVSSNMNIAENRLPQDGHMLKEINYTDPMIQQLVPVNLDVRVSTFPTVFGEAVTMRLLNSNHAFYPQFEQMGIRSEDAERLREAIKNPYGMILSTGPSGSGKTTMLYTAINLIRSEEKNIVTLEDPVEYQIEGLRQAQVNQAIGFTFSAGLRSILRQDPDVIMIGEIRDIETAEVAIRAALTGRLLLASMHTNDSITTVMRFLEFGIPRSAIANALKVIIAQRLIRLNCPHCVANYSPAVTSLQAAGINKPLPGPLKRGAGCNYCYQSGFLGRKGIYEILFINKPLEMLILEGVSYQKLTEAAQANGLKTLRQLALELVLQGKTTLEEAIHSTA